MRGMDAIDQIFNDAHDALSEALEKFHLEYPDISVTHEYENYVTDNFGDRTISLRVSGEENLDRYLYIMVAVKGILRWRRYHVKVVGYVNLAESGPGLADYMFDEFDIPLSLEYPIPHLYQAIRIALYDTLLWQWEGEHYRFMDSKFETTTF